MTELTTKKKKRYILLFNRIIRREFKKDLILTPSKLTEEQINIAFDKIFEKKNHYYVPKNKLIKIDFDENEFKNLYKFKLTKEDNELIKKVERFYELEKNIKDYQEKLKDKKTPVKYIYDNKKEYDKNVDEVISLNLHQDDIDRYNEIKEFKTKQKEKKKKAPKKIKEKKKKEDEKKAEQLKEVYEEEAKEDLSSALDFISKFNSNTTAYDFVRQNLGTKTAFIYILEKHKNDCLVFNNDTVYKSMTWYYYARSDKHYMEPNYPFDEYDKKIEDCIKAKKRFIAIPLIIVEKKSAHQNMIILDLKMKTAERYEPHGGSTSGWEKISDEINEHLKHIFEEEFKIHKFKYIPPFNVCPKMTKELINKIGITNQFLNHKEGKYTGFQSFENLFPSGDDGYCVAWSLFYLDSRLSAPSYTPEELYIHIFKKLKADPSEFLKFIRGYASFLGKIYNNIYDDFISKYPEFNKLKKAYYNGTSPDKLYEAKKIKGKKNILSLSIKFEGYVNKLLLQVIGDETLKTPDEKEKIKQLLKGDGKKKRLNGGMCKCLKGGTKKVTKIKGGLCKCLNH
jgi:hypothetical protein